MSNKKTVVVLFTYGGGMRGIIPARIMARIEEQTGMRMAEMVDVFTGPSTGAILNTALNVPDPKDPKTPRFKAAHLVRFYEQEGIRIFPQDRFRDFRAFVHDFNNRTMKIGQLKSLFRHGHYDPAYLSKCLYDLYGDHKLQDSLKSLIIPVYNIDGGELKTVQEKGETLDTPVHTTNNLIDGGGHAVWLKKMHLHRNRMATHDVRLHDAVLASCSAPTYFPCHHFEATPPTTGIRREYSGIDGSIFDNPCTSYHGAIRQHLDSDTRVVMIVLGTGYTLQSIRKDEWNSYGGLGVVDPVNDLPLINILFHASESALVDSFRQELDDNLFVFNKSMVGSEEISKDNTTPSKAIDDASPENLERMHVFADKIIEENHDRFDKLCKFLKQHGQNDAKGAENVSFFTRAKRLFGT